MTSFCFYLNIQGNLSLQDCARSYPKMSRDDSTNLFSLVVTQKIKGIKTTLKAIFLINNTGCFNETRLIIRHPTVPEYVEF
jgi:hypothetical protein